MPLFNLGFRPFFLAAGLFAVVSMIAWGLAYRHLISLPISMNSMYWHGHEMIYGYAVAVLAGFLLTSVRNWTGLPTPKGIPLALLLGLWLAARIAFWLGHLTVAMAADLLFGLALLFSLLIPLIKTRQRAQTGLMALLVLLLSSNQLFYLIATQTYDPFAPAGHDLSSYNLRCALETGLYILVAIVLMMIGRLLPAFTRMATAGQVELTNSFRLDTPMTLLMVLFICFAPGWSSLTLAMKFEPARFIALLLALLHGYRLWNWHHWEIATRPLLWVIYVAYFFFITGFFAYAAKPLGIPDIVATHAFAVGGVGMATLGLMARVALGHTGRDVYQPPKMVLPMVLLLALGAVTRVFAPLFLPQFYLQGVVAAQFFWVAAFSVFLVVYTPLLLTARPDGNPG